MKAAREKEQETAREAIENLKMKQQRERTQEMNVTMSSPSRLPFPLFFHVSLPLVSFHS